MQPDVRAPTPAISREAIALAPPCHCLAIRQAARQVTQVYDRHLAPTGLRATQYAVLRVIRRHGPVSMQACSEWLVMDRTTLSRALRPLEREGLVTVATGADARVRMLSLSEAGQAFLARTQNLWENAQNEFETRYGVNEVATLRAGLARVVIEID